MFIISIKKKKAIFDNAYIKIKAKKNVVENSLCLSFILKITFFKVIFKSTIANNKKGNIISPLSKIKHIKETTKVYIKEEM